MGTISRDAGEDFVAKWSGVTASELSTAQSFALDLCQLLGVEAPHPDAEQQYMFERPVTFTHGDGSTSAGRIDLYKRGCFVLEAKKLRAPTHTRGFDDALLRARSQAEQYARALPASEGRPPFLIVLDVGNRIELYAEFSRSGATYTPFPDPRSHRMALAEFCDEAVRERLRRVWTDPLSLDPARESARVTCDIAARLAKLARSLESVGHPAEWVAQFLMRCLFTMFAEDVKLLPSESFRNLLLEHADRPDVAMRMLAQLWRDMDSGGFCVAIASDVLRFNGKLFKQPDTLPLDRAQIGLLIEAARAKWEHVEPAIFGTLLERALDPGERHKLGAHYTPRAYVERLVLPAVIEPLRREWSDVQVAALSKLAVAEEWRTKDRTDGKLRSQKERFKQYQIELRKARDLVIGFHKRLCNVRVLDPACGSGNFLYVTLEHLKRLEGEVLNTLEEYGLTRAGVGLQTDLDVETQRVISTEAETVDPHQLLGIELNPRAAAIAEVVLWIGYLQWHYRTRGDVNPPQPVIRDFRNIENRDAVLAYDRMEYVLDERGVPVSRWDGISMKSSPVTGENVPDDRRRMPLERYINPRKAAWPQADFVVGNPPFIGASSIRRALGDGYAEALRATWPEVPESADFVMYWWHHAAVLTQQHAVERFGFITTNSIRQRFNRRVVEAALSDKKQPLSLSFAIPDHPWVDSVDGAAVRIAMTIGAPGTVEGLMRVVETEVEGKQDEVAVTLRDRDGLIHADLSMGSNVSAAKVMRSNGGISGRGLQLIGSGFIVSPEQARQLGLGTVDGLELHIRPYRNGRDLTNRPRKLFVIDLFGLEAEEIRNRFPATYQHVLDHVKPERDQNSRATYRENWWIHGEPRGALRPALVSLSRYIATVETAKHRTFQFLDASIVPDNKLIAIALDDACMLAVLSSTPHIIWAIASGSHLGVGNDPVYVKSRCFDPFPFPTSTDNQQNHLRALAEQLDAHRKRQQAAHPDLTLTGMYNVLEKLRSGEPLTVKERVIHERGLVSVLRQLHDEIDAAVLDAYGWADLLPPLRIAHALLPSPPGRRAGDEGTSPQPLRKPKSPLPDDVREFARRLRRDQTDPERLMWQLLRDRRLHQVKFRRQHPQPPYTLDFYCHELRLAVELDGSQHLDSRKDAVRDAALEGVGIDVIRYWNHDVLARTEQVLEDLWGQVDYRLAAKAPSPPTPLPGGEGSKAISTGSPAAMEKDQAQARHAFDEAILERLVALNAERAAEEARGLVRWLRPTFQHPTAGADAATQERMLEADGSAGITVAIAAKPQPWPKDATAQVRAVADAIAASPVPLSLDELAARFTAHGPWKKRLPQLLDMLVALGRASERDGRYVSG